MYKTKLRAIGKSKGVILPKELVDRMGLQEGDTLVVRETPHGYVIDTENEEFDRFMALTEKVIHQYRNTLKRLAE